MTSECFWNGIHIDHYPCANKSAFNHNGFARALFDEGPSSINTKIDLATGRIYRHDVSHVVRRRQKVSAMQCVLHVDLFMRPQARYHVIKVPATSYGLLLISITTRSRYSIFSANAITSIHKPDGRGIKTKGQNCPDRA